MHLYSTLPPHSLDHLHTPHLHTPSPPHSLTSTLPRSPPHPSPPHSLTSTLPHLHTPSITSTPPHLYTPLLHTELPAEPSLLDQTPTCRTNERDPGLVRPADVLIELVQQTTCRLGAELVGLADHVWSWHQRTGASLFASHHCHGLTGYVSFNYWLNCW